MELPKNPITDHQSARVILMDPPWRYSQAWSGKKVHGAASAHYRTMSDDEIQDLPVETWVSKDGCVLALWATLPRLDSAMDTLRWWGFTYKTAIPWIKTTKDGSSPRRGIGIWFQQCSEIVLFGQRGQVIDFQDRRGTLGLLCGDDPQDAVLWAPGRAHSEKPHDLYEYLDQFPGPHLELFATAPRPGWTSWGLSLGQELGPWGVREVPPQDYRRVI